MAETQQKSSWWDVFKTFFWAVVIALVFRTFAFEPFHIPSPSMLPNLLVGDFVIVSKYSYGYSNHSLPMTVDIVDGRIMYTAPKRGDIIVFHSPNPNDAHGTLIKRLVGLPGDKIQMKGGVLYINEKPLLLERDGDYEYQNKGFVDHFEKYQETLPEGLKHEVLDENKNELYDDTEELTVPEGHFFMMGDNRDNSADSRAGLGFIPVENLVGRAELILFSSKGMLMNPIEWRADRFFKKL